MRHIKKTPKTEVVPYSITVHHCFVYKYLPLPAEAVHKIPELTPSWWWVRKEAKAQQKYSFNSSTVCLLSTKVLRLRPGQSPLEKVREKYLLSLLYRKMMLGRVYDTQYQLTLDPGNFTVKVHPVSRSTSVKLASFCWFHFIYCKYIHIYTSLLWCQHQTDKTSSFCRVNPLTGIKSWIKLRKPYQVNHKTESPILPIFSPMDE